MRLILLVLLLGACTATPSPITKQPNAMCVNDCLGAGGTRDFCDSRCSD